MSEMQNWTMFDRVAWAIGRKLIDITPPDGKVRMFTGDDIRLLTRVAIDEMRNPSVDMCDAEGVVDAYEGKFERPESDSQHRRWVWQAMIDAALSQSGK